MPELKNSARTSVQRSYAQPFSDIKLSLVGTLAKSFFGFSQLYLLRTKNNLWKKIMAISP